MYIYNGCLGLWLPAPTGADTCQSAPDDPDMYYGLGYISDEDSKDLIYRCCERVSGYILENRIANLVLLDRSARPALVGIRQYWRLAYGGEKMPRAYILNPRGFISRENISWLEKLRILYRLHRENDFIGEFLGVVRAEEQIAEEIRTCYPELCRDKDKPILIFDTCCHTGFALRHIRLILERMGFSRIRICTVSQPDPHSISGRPEDWYICLEERTCFPFGGERAVAKTFASVRSRRVDEFTEESQKRYLLIRDIIREKFRQPKKPPKKTWRRFFPWF